MAEQRRQGWLFEAPAEEQGANPFRGFAKVALDLPTRTEFSYGLLPDMENIAVGCRVRVPLGGRSVLGVVVGLDRYPPPNVLVQRIRPLTEILDPKPLLTPALLRLARFVADSSFCSWGNALAAMLPVALRRDRKRRSIPVVEVVQEPSPEEITELQQRFPKQEQAWAWLQAAGGPVEVREFLGRTGLSRSPLESLAKRGWIRFRRKQEWTDPFAADRVSRSSVRPEPTREQWRCIRSIRTEIEANRHAAFLLFGITGSGKTEVYLRALETCLEGDRGAIIIVPEIALTPQTVARFRSRCDKVAVLHSGLSDVERHDQWVAIQDGRLRVVVGARSAIFAPIRDLGLIVIDEEHESTFKQEQTPRYHAREVALERSRLENAVCVLGSATPSLESWHGARTGSLARLDLCERVAGGQLPDVQLVDMRQQKPQGGKWHIISESLRLALERTLHEGSQAILFLNQRGFAPAWHCRHCGKSVVCEQCDVSLTFHRWRDRAVCHYCLGEYSPPVRCPHCAHEVALVGVGTERAEMYLEQLFPKARFARMDRDTMLRRESYEKVLSDFGAGRYDVLLGTQMVAKGLDFPHVTLVGVLNADIALHHPDFRSAERCFNLIAQVSGRAGRSTKKGRVVVQTWWPEHPAIQAAAAHDYQGFADQELRERSEFGYPPFTTAIRVQVEADTEAKVEELATDAARRIHGSLEGQAVPIPVVLGPGIPPVARLKGKHLRQILIKAPPTDVLEPLSNTLYDLSQRQAFIVDKP